MKFLRYIRTGISLTAILLLLCGAAYFPEYKIGKKTYSRLKDLIASQKLRVRKGATRIEVYDPSTEKSPVVLYKGKNYLYFNSTRIALSSPAVINKNGSLVSKMDGLKTIVPLLEKGSVYRHKVGTVVLDPGHGGKDQGASNGRTKEKELNLSLAKRVEKYLKAQGYRVLLTRRGDTFLSLQSRPAFANAEKADLYVAIHTNSAVSKKPNGIEVFCLAPAGTASTNSSTVSWKSYAGNKNDAKNIRLAYHLQRSLLVKTKAKDMGVKRARFAVLKDLKCPGALVEIGFLSNPEEVKKLRTSEYMDKLAKGIANGISNYCISMR
jgi:N-acetylmuramoyl-L-alanine amidase